MSSENKSVFEKRNSYVGADWIGTVIMACQCIWYLNHGITAPKFAKFLKDDGSFLILYMGWLPFEDEIAGKSEALYFDCMA